MGTKTTKTTLDEAALRREGWVDGEPIVLGDGQTWTVPRPILEFGMVFGADGSVGFSKKDLGFGADYNAKFLAYIDAPGGAPTLMAGAELVVALVRRNYGLTNEQLAILLPYRPGDPANVAMWGALTDVAVGNAPPKGGPPDDT